MKQRWVAAIVCALYMSVGLVFAVTHDHSAEALDGHQQCATCAWHHDGQADVPATTARVSPPQALSLPPAVHGIFIFEVAIGLHPSRGPPSLPPR